MYIQYIYDNRQTSGMAAATRGRDMRLTTFSDYGLRVLIYLAVRADRPATIGEIAASYGISGHHLVKVVHFLGQAGFLQTTRGRGGGIRLAMAANAINIADVVHLTEGRDIPVECFDPEANTCRITRNCRLRSILDEAVGAFYAVLGMYTLQDLARNRQALAKILFHPSASPGGAPPN